MGSRLLVKISAKTSQTTLAANSNLLPLFEVRPQAEGFGLASESATWCVADRQDMGPLPRDAAHGRVADILGLEESDVLFAEPDLPQRYPTQNETNEGGDPFALSTPNCQPAPQYDDQRKPGPGFAWHLRDEFSQLATARGAVAFGDPRTTIAHIDTGYDPNHSARPARIRHDLERNFVKADGTPNDASDPGRNHLFDNSGHGTGTSSILAGQSVPLNNGQPLGGAPDADIVPLRIANSVVLFFTSAVAAALNYAVEIKCDVVSMS
jgi:subtilisin family serine protease